MQTYYAIKRPNAWFWSEKLTRDDVLSKLTSYKITLDWSICPLGEARHAVTIREFFNDPEILARAQQQEHDQQLQQQKDLAAIQATLAKPWILVFSDQLAPAIFVVLAIAGIFTKVFIIQLAKKDPPFQEFGWYLVVIFWTLMSLALGSAIVGKMLLRYRVKKIYEERNLRQ